MKQRALTQERKATKPNADLIARSKKIWERLRRKSHVPLEERKSLVAELFDIITGRVKDFVFKHDSVRVIQTALKYANVDQRKMISRELKGEFRGLAESKYAKFLIGKLLVHGDFEIRDMIIPELYGHVRRMIKHPEASWILDDVYRGAATPKQKAHLLREWYGPEFALFKDQDSALVSADLKELLEKYPEKRSPIMRSLQDLINALVQKKTTGFTMLHDAMLQYFLNVQPGSEEVNEFIELLKGDEAGDLLKNLAFTKCGARLVCLALANGNAKDRKIILRTYKGIIQTLAYDSYGHQILLAAYDVIDDTVFSSKAIFPELIGNEPFSDEQNQDLLATVTHLAARVVLLYPFAGRAKAIVPTADLSLIDEIHKARLNSSKKDPETRRQELIACLSPSLLSFIQSNIEQLILTSFGCQFITEVLLNANRDRAAALNAIGSIARGNAETLSTPSAGRMLKALVLGGHFNPKLGRVDAANPPLEFHNILYSHIKGSIVDWATGNNSFVVVGLLEAEGFSEVEGLRKTLMKHHKRLIKAAEESAEHTSNGGKSRSAPSGSGNKGTQLLLKKLRG